MSDELERSTGNVYRDLGCADPDDALARADLMLDIVEEIHRQGLDLKETLNRLQVEKERYFELLGGRVQRFTQEELRDYLARIHAEIDPSQAHAHSEEGGEWLHLPGRMIGALRDWLADMLDVGAPRVGGFAPGYRGRSRVVDLTRQSKQHSATHPRQPPAVQGLDDRRFGWLPTLVKQEEEGLSLVLQCRDLTSTADEEPPRVSVFINGEPIAVNSLDYNAGTGRLELFLDGKLPAPDFNLVISPSDNGVLTLHLRGD